MNEIYHCFTIKEIYVGVCPQPWVVFFVFRELGYEVIVRIVDIGGIVDHHCRPFLFIISTINNEHKSEWTSEQMK